MTLQIIPDEILARAMDMGFSKYKTETALRENNMDVERAIEWALNQPEIPDDEPMEENKEEDSNRLKEELKRKS